MNFARKTFRYCFPLLLTLAAVFLIMPAEARPDHGQNSFSSACLLINKN
jgi:hypothetical protein